MLTTEKVPLYCELVDRMKDKHVQSGHSFDDNQVQVLASKTCCYSNWAFTKTSKK